MYFFSRETALRETGLEDSRLLLLYTAQKYTSILGLFLFYVLVGTLLSDHLLCGVLIMLVDSLVLFLVNSFMLVNSLVLVNTLVLVLVNSLMLVNPLVLSSV